MKRIGKSLSALLAVAACAGCGQESYDEGAPRVQAFQITVANAEGVVGSPEAAKPFPSTTPAEARLTIEAIGADGSLFSTYNQKARLRVVPGEIVGGDRVQFVDGRATVTLKWRFSYDLTHIWVEDVGEDPASECENGIDDDQDGVMDLGDPDCQKYEGTIDQEATMSTGVSETFYFNKPKIEDLQYSPRCTTDTPLGSQNVTIEDGTLIVTGTTQSGMYVTDLQRWDQGYGSVYLYTHSNPGDVRRGDRLCLITGNAAEFIGNTQLNFPDFVNADFNRNGQIDAGDYLPCDLPEPERIGPDAVPEPKVLTAENLTGVGGVVPANFYKPCGPNATELDIEDGTDCAAAAASMTREERMQTSLDCKRDNFAVEPWEHGLVAVENVVVSTRYEVCDINEDGKIDRTAGNPEGVCEKDCTADPLCTVSMNLDLYGQFSAGIDCTGEGDNVQCPGKVYIAFKDTLGGVGYDARDNAGKKYTKVIGHLRQLQPGAGIETVWIIEPRFIEDFVSGDTQP